MQFTTERQAYSNWRMTLLRTVVTGILTTLGLPTADAASYDLNTDWGNGSGLSNPNGTWSLRYGDGVLPLHYWLPSEGAGIRY